LHEFEVLETIAFHAISQKSRSDGIAVLDAHCVSRALMYPRAGVEPAGRKPEQFTLFIQRDCRDREAPIFGEGSMTTFTSQAHADLPAYPVDDDGFAFDFPGMSAGQEYTVKLLLGEIRTHGHRDTLFSIAANGQTVLRHGAIVTSASPSDGAARVSFVTSADDNGQIQIWFSGFTHKQILGIEILTGKHLPPDSVEGLTAFAGNSHVHLKWQPVPEAVSYIVKRRTANHGQMVPIAANITEPKYTDLMIGRDEIYQYTVIALNAFGEGDPCRPVTANPPFRISITPLSVQVLRGQNAICAVMANVQDGMDGAIVLSSSGAKAGMMVWFDKAKLSIPDSAGAQHEVIDRMHIAADASTLPGRHEVVVRAAYGDYSTSVPVSVTVL